MYKKILRLVHQIILAVATKVMISYSLFKYERICHFLSIFFVFITEWNRTPKTLLFRIKFLFNTKTLMLVVVGQGLSSDSKISYFINRFAAVYLYKWWRYPYKFYTNIYWYVNIYFKMYSPNTPFYPIFSKTIILSD